MDVAIKPFWIILSIVYFWLAAIHYKRQFGVFPSTYQAAANTPAPDNAPDEIRYLYAYTQTAFKQFLRDIKENKKLMIYASTAFFAAGAVSLLQGLTNLEAAFSVNIVFVVLIPIIALSILYWRRRWVFAPITGLIYRYRIYRQKKLYEKKSEKEF